MQRRCSRCTGSERESDQLADRVAGEGSQGERRDETRDARRSDRSQPSSLSLSVSLCQSLARKVSRDRERERGRCPVEQSWSGCQRWLQSEGERLCSCRTSQLVKRVKGAGKEAERDRDDRVRGRQRTSQDGKELRGREVTGTSCRGDARGSQACESSASAKGRDKEVTWSGKETGT